MEPIAMIRSSVYLFLDEDDEACRRTRDLLNELKVPYREIDVEKNGAKGWMCFDLGYCDVPVLTSGDMVISGYKNIETYVRYNRDALI